MPRKEVGCYSDYIGICVCLFYRCLVISAGVVYVPMAVVDSSGTDRIWCGTIHPQSRRRVVGYSNWTIVSFPGGFPCHC